MKVFAIITACLMAAGGATYYVSSSEGGCPFGGCSTKTETSCCSTNTAKATPDCCTIPCPACSTDCQECCAVCESCCEAGAKVSAPASVAVNVVAEEECCAACSSPVRIATSAVVAGASLK